MLRIIQMKWKKIEEELQSKTKDKENELNAIRDTIGELNKKERELRQDGLRHKAVFENNMDVYGWAWWVSCRAMAKSRILYWGRWFWNMLKLLHT